MGERLLSDNEFELASRAADAVMGREQTLPSNLAAEAGQFVDNSPFFSGFVQVEQRGEDVAMVRSEVSQPSPDFRFGESVTSEVRAKRTTASGQKVNSK